MYHNPVLLKQSVDDLVTRPDGIYVDCTFGGGGHSSEILQRLSPQGRLFGFDQDLDALKNNIEDERFTLSIRISAFWKIRCSFTVFPR